MNCFGQTLRAVLVRRDIARSEFATAVGLKPNHISQIFGGGQKVGANLAAKILDEFSGEDLAELAAAYLVDELGKVELARKAKGAELGLLVEIRPKKRSKVLPVSPIPLQADLFSEPVQRRLRQFAELAVKEPGLLNALDAFLSAMIRSQQDDRKL